MLLGGLHPEYKRLYEGMIEPAKKHVFFRPLNKNNLDILISGNARAYGDDYELDPEGQHLGCFVGGMVGIASKIFDRDEIDIARKLTDGCVWTYESMVTGIGPESFRAIPCDDHCQWNETLWISEIIEKNPDFDGGPISEWITKLRLEPGFAEINSPDYFLR
jgi:mannosyl-oligosaccharide alpha-1,2-mannosidase